MTKEIKLLGTQNFMGKEIPVVLGGFGEDKKVILAKTVAELHDMEVKHVNELINRNIQRFKDGVDYLDLGVVLNDTELRELGFTQQALNSYKGLRAKEQGGNIYLLSERGYAKLIKIMDSDLAWEIHDKLIDDYFKMRDGIKPMITTDPAIREMQMWDMTSNMLRLGDWDKLKGIETVYNNHGINTNVLPKLKQDERGDLRSITDLLERYEHTYDGKKLSNRKANDLLVEHGFLENRKRPSTSGKGTYKSLLPKAQGIYGENINNTHGSSQQTNPEWYENKFCELMALIGATLKEKKVA